MNNVANFVTTLPNLVGFVDLRSYGQMSTFDPTPIPLDERGVVVLKGWSRSLILLLLFVTIFFFSFVPIFVFV